MELETMLGILGVGIGLSSTTWMFLSKLGVLEKHIERLEEKIMDRFNDHKEDHQEHHKEISKMFDGVATALAEHVTEERVHNALAQNGQHCVHGKSQSDCVCKRSGIK